jgi:hypothetical protein
MAKEKVKDKGAKKVRGTANRLSRADKMQKRLKGISAKTGFKAKSALFTFTVFAPQVVEIPGFIVSQQADSVLFRHKRTNASKRMLVSRFAGKDIIELYGNEGETSSITVMREVPVREVVGKLIEDKNGVMTIQTASGETVKIFQNSNVRVEVSVEDETEAGESGKKSKKDKKADKKADKSSKKKKRKDEDEDDLDD